MMGTSLLAMPWSVGQAGLLMALVVSFVMGLIATSTAVLVVKLHKRMSKYYSNILILSRALIRMP